MNEKEKVIYLKYLKDLDHLMMLNKKVALTKHINWLIAQITDYRFQC